MHKNLLKLSKIEEKEEKKSQAKLGQSLVKTIPNWLKMSQSAKGGLKRKDFQYLFSVDSEANNMVYDINLIN